MTRLVLDAPVEMAAIARGLGFMDGHARISALTDDSREVRPGDAYICMPRAGERAHAFVEQAIRQGAAGVVLVGQRLDADVAALHVPDAEHLAAFVQRALGIEDMRVQLVGITGTDGKTSVCWMLRQALERLGRRAWGLGTLGVVRDGERIEPLANTTPSLLFLHGLLRQAQADGVDWLVMEVSSHGIAQHRIAGLAFAAAIWTSIGRDHLDDHGGYDPYLETKASFVRQVAQAGGCAIANGDHRDIRAALNDLAGVRFYARRQGGEDAHLRWQQPRPGCVELACAGAELSVAPIPLGEFHAENVAAVAACLHFAMQWPLKALASALAGIGAPPGRMEPVGSDARVFIDYAHTPEALERCLRSARQLTAGRLLVVFGCGGERDRAKRPRMGAIAATCADEVWVTSDNPRSEPPARILEDICAGVPESAASRVHCVADRERAIAEAIASLGERDVLIIAGKGHEPYMEANGERRPWSDRDAALRRLGENSRADEAACG